MFFLVAGNAYDPAVGAGTDRSDQLNLFHPRGGGAAAWAKTEASASFWTIADATAPGTNSNPSALPHPAPVDGGRDVGRTFFFLPPKNTRLHFK